MIIHTFWVLHDGETPECIVAWDEYSIEVNPEGWERDKKNVLNSYGMKTEDAREIRIKVDDYDILAAFRNEPITGEVI